MYSFYPITIKVQENSSVTTIGFPNFEPLQLVWPELESDANRLAAEAVLRTRLASRLICLESVPMPTVLDGPNDEEHDEVIYIDVMDHLRLQALNALCAFSQKKRAIIMRELENALTDVGLLKNDGDIDVEDVIQALADLTKPVTDLALLLTFSECVGVSLAVRDIAKKPEAAP